MEQNCNSIFSGRVLKFPMKMLENSRALGDSRLDGPC